jgi:hypothetical protein
MRPLLALVLAIVLLDARGGEVGDACVTDLDALPGFLLANDAGGRDIAAQRGPALDEALERARARARGAVDDAACIDALRGYLRAWRHGHLSIVALQSAGTAAGLPAPTISDPRAPRFRVLSPQTALLTLPTFNDRYAPLIEGLIAAHRREIVARPNLIIDVRRNNGGSDSSYAPILPFVAANVTRTPNAEFLATPDNIAASEAVCKLPEVASAVCLQFMAPVIEAMKAAPAGSYVLPVGAPRIEVEAPRRVLASPRRIAVMIDRACGSSCEEFVLVVRQSFKVKTFGRPTAGSLDYSNLRPHDLPSGKRRIFYATSRSLRLPANPIDAGGIAPDQLLPIPDNEAAFAAEVETVRGVLEGRAPLR